MAKITNNENMRRYVHKKLSKIGNEEITIDDITPELLQSIEVQEKINNWGLSSEDIQNFPEIVFQVSEVNSNLSLDEDLRFKAKLDYCRIDGNDVRNFSELPDLSADGYKYIVYNKNNTSPVVLKRIVCDSDYIEYESFSTTLVIEFDEGDQHTVQLQVGYDTW